MAHERGRPLSKSSMYSITWNYALAGVSPVIRRFRIRFRKLCWEPMAEVPSLTEAAMWYKELRWHGTPNPDLKWERTEQVDLGLDFAFFNNRLSGTVDLFSKVTRDVLLEVYAISPAPTSMVWSQCARHEDCKQRYWDRFKRSDYWQ